MFNSIGNNTPPSPPPTANSELKRPSPQTDTEPTTKKVKIQNAQQKKATAPSQQISKEAPTLPPQQNIMSLVTGHEMNSIKPPFLPQDGPTLLNTYRNSICALYNDIENLVRSDPQKYGSLSEVSKQLKLVFEKLTFNVTDKGLIFSLAIPKSLFLDTVKATFSSLESLINSSTIPDRTRDLIASFLNRNWKTTKILDIIQNLSERHPFVPAPPLPWSIEPKLIVKPLNFEDKQKLLPLVAEIFQEFDAVLKTHEQTKTPLEQKWLAFEKELLPELKKLVEEKVASSKLLTVLKRSQFPETENVGKKLKILHKTLDYKLNLFAVHTEEFRLVRFSKEAAEKTVRNKKMEETVLTLFLNRLCSNRKHSNVIIFSKSHEMALQFVSSLQCKMRELEEGSSFKNGRIVWVRSEQMIANCNELGFQDQLKQKIYSIFQKSMDWMDSTGNKEITVLNQMDLLYANNNRSNEKTVPLFIESFLNLNSSMNILGLTQDLTFYEQNRKYLHSFEFIQLEPPSREELLQSLIFFQSQFDCSDHDLLKRIITLCDRYLPNEPSPERVAQILSKASAENIFNNKKPPFQLDENQFKRIIAEKADIPLSLLKDDHKINSSLIKQEIETTIKGQSFAVEAVSSAICTFFKGLHNKKRPPGIFVFVGQTGVGKTELAKEMARVISGKQEKCSILNMGQFYGKHALATLVGAPPGYIKTEEGGRLPNLIKNEKPSVILFDEIEKADKDVLKGLLRFFDEGVVQQMSGDSQDFSAKNIFIVMTSNVGAHEILELSENGTKPVKEAFIQKIVEDKLGQLVGPEWVGRVEIIPFQPLTEQSFKEIIELKLSRLKIDLQEEHDLTLTWQSNVIDYLYNAGVDPLKGARSVDAILSKKIRSQIADVDFRKGDTLFLEADGAMERIVIQRIPQANAY